MLIDRHAVAQFLDRRFDNYTWVKKLRREQILDELSRLRTRPRFKTDPWLHQLACVLIGIYNPRFLFLLDMGLGKSKILMDLITHVQRERKLDRALITVPRQINLYSWRDDILKHSDLEPNIINVSDIEAKRELLLKPRGDVTVIDYQGLQWAICDRNKKTGKLKRNDKLVKYLAQEYNWLGIDESHKLSNHNNLWFGFMDQIAQRMEYCYATTGTLFGKDVEDLWGQFYLVDGGETFGENLSLFRKSFFTTKVTAWKGTTRVYNQKMESQLHKMIQHKSLRYDEDEVPELDLPRRVMREHVFEMAEEQRDHYMRALEGLINAGGQVQNLEANWLRMRQIVSGYLAWKDEHGDHVLRFKKNPKLDGLEAIIDGIGRSKIVVCYDYTETGRMICDRIKEMGLGYEWFYGGTKDQEASRDRFMRDPKCKVFVMNSEAGGTGNDGLQKVARYMAFYETPTPPITRKQTIKRIHRPGQTERAFIYDLVMKQSLDRGILDDIAEGIDTYNGVVNGKRLSKNYFLRD